MLAFRSTLFNIYFFSVSTLLFTVGTLSLLLPDPAALRMVQWWIRSTFFGLRILVGLRYEVTGLEHVTLPCILASKHQSTWETLVFHLIFENPAYAAKKELSRLTLGLFMRHLKQIVVDRTGGRSALKVMLEQSKNAAQDGRALVIFPEGTRSDPGEKGHYQKGVAALYQALNLPVVPVALNSGFFWGRRSFIKKPGVIHLAFLPPIQPGLKSDAFMEAMENAIETACHRLPKN